MPFLFAPPVQPVIPVQDERYEFIPIRRVYCVSDNYAPAGGPSVFMRPADVIVPVEDGATFRMRVPEDAEELAFGVELIGIFGQGGRALSPESAQKAFWGWCVGVAFTRVDGGDDLGVLDGALPVSRARPAYRTPMPAPADIYLYKNNVRMQSARTSAMRVSPEGLAGAISERWMLMPGDLLLTGTPQGAGTARRGDVLLAGVNGVGTLRIELV